MGRLASLISRNFAGLGLMGGLFLSSAAMAQDLSAVEIKTTDLGSGIYMFVGAGGNLGASVGADGVFLIDGQYAPLTDKILAALDALGGGDIKYVLNTHWHGDHTGSNERLGGQGSVILAHRNVRKRMTSEQFSNLRQSTTPPSPKAAWPVVTFDGNVELYFNGETLRVMSLSPAHTDGDSMVFMEKANVLHLGDTFFHTWYPFIDVDSGGDLDGMIEAQERGLALVDKDTKIIPGHGPLANNADLQRAHDKLVRVRAVLQAAIDKGMSDADILASNPLEALDLGWGGFLSAEQFVSLALLSMRK